MQLKSTILLAISLCDAVIAGSHRGRSKHDLTIKTGQPSGEVKQISNGTNVYFTGPADSETGVLFLTDIFGINFTNSLLVADTYAAQGYYTIVPDLFDGDSVDPNYNPATFNLSAWSANHQPANVDPIIASTLADIRASTNIKRLGVVGYCFGGKYVARWLGRSDAGIDAGFTAHPSSTTPAEWAGVLGPLSIANAELDTTFPLSQARAAEDTLRNLTIAWQFSTYSDVPHGFAIRANDSLPRQVFAKQAAFEQAVRWFAEYVSAAPNATYGGPAARIAYGEKSFAEEHRAVVAGPAA